MEWQPRPGHPVWLSRHHQERLDGDLSVDKRRSLALARWTTKPDR
jgi:hypothetical protein